MIAINKHTVSDNSQINYLLISCLFAMLFVSKTLVFSQVQKVDLVRSEGNWNLMVEEKPYFIKGAGGTVHLDIVKACGGNTIRTWGLENAQFVLDEAEKHGLKVMLGMWVQHERHGFDYNDEEKIKNQLENFRLAVRKYKDHPALLLWGVGNEYELEYSNTKVWKAVNDIARMVHLEDPNHPTSTVTAGTNAEKLKFVMSELTEIDIYGINTYGDISSVAEVLKAGGFERPYMITEWGPNGHWESPKTRWGSSIEQTSTEKAKVYHDRYLNFIEAKKNQCIGSFAFLWGQKQEYTSTWYGLFNEEGIQTEAIDQLQFCWSGSYPDNRAPSVEKVLIDDKELTKDLVLEPYNKHLFKVFASDPNNDKLHFRWELYPESTDLKSGGDAESKPPLVYGKLKGNKSNSVQLKVPTIEGRYRLFVEIKDNEKVAYTNIPFYVEMNPNQKAHVGFKKQTLKSFDEE